MATKVGVNGRTVVHKDSGGTVSFMPDVCKTPQPSGPPVPIPYPNTAISADADKEAKSVLCDGNPILIQGSTFKQSTGDEAGSAGGVTSGKTKGAAEFIGYSFNVFVEGKGVVRQGDLMLGNKGSAVNTPPAPLQQPPMPAVKKVARGELKPDRIELTVTDMAGNALADVRYVLTTPERKKVEGKTDGSGKIKVDDTVTGIGKLSFLDVPLARVTVREG